MGGFGIDPTLLVFQVGPGQLSWQPQFVPPEPLVQSVQHLLSKQAKQTGCEDETTNKRTVSLENVISCIQVMYTLSHS